MKVEDGQKRKHDCDDEGSTPILIINDSTHISILNAKIPGSRSNPGATVRMPLRRSGIKR